MGAHEIEGYGMHARGDGVGETVRGEGEAKTNETGRVNGGRGLKCITVEKGK